jgi:hypothetical protein
MAQRVWLGIAIERFSHNNLPVVEFAEGDALKLAERLSRGGIAETDRHGLIGSAATKTSTESRLRKLTTSLTTGDELFLFYTGRGGSVDEQSVLFAYDTDPAEMAETGLLLADLWRRFTTRGIRLRLFLDVGSTVVGKQTFELNEEEIEELIHDSPESFLWLSCKPEQFSQVASSLGQRLWGHHLLKAISGEAKIKNLGKDQRLTADLLAQHLKSELPRTARKILASPTKQTPCFFGASGDEILIADLNHRPPERPTNTQVNLDQVKRIIFRSVSTGKVKDLAGYQKGHRLPDQVSASGKRFVAKIAMDDIRLEIEEFFNQLREQMGFKRKDLEASAEKEGLGFIRTPAFDYTVQAEMDDTDPTLLRWTREVTHIQDPALIRSTGFQAVFGTMFDTLRFDFSEPINVSDFVDRFEDEPIKGVKLRTSIDGSNCDLTIEGFLGSIRLEPDCLIISGRSSSAGSLIDQFFEFQRRFAKENSPLMLADR